ncbi:hypothetical protein GCM10010206_47030 [Streptomyces cinerochromogenes]|nr:hypothetical protein GCM10010206_47030 [Streptomyces cinerochromogenes]
MRPIVRVRSAAPGSLPRAAAGKTEAYVRHRNDSFHDRRARRAATRPRLPGVTLVAAGWAARRDDGLDRLVSVVDIGALSAFTLLHASVVGYFVRRRGELSWWRHVLVPVAGAVVTVTVIVEASGAAQAVGAAWLAAGLLVPAGQRGRREAPR